MEQGEALRNKSRCSSKEVRIGVPVFLQSISVADTSPKRGKRAQLGDLEMQTEPMSSDILKPILQLVPSGFLPLNQQILSTPSTMRPTWLRSRGTRSTGSGVHEFGGSPALFSKKNRRPVVKKWTPGSSEPDSSARNESRPTLLLFEMQSIPTFTKDLNKGSSLRKEYGPKQESNNKKHFALIWLCHLLPKMASTRKPLLGRPISF